MRSFTMTRLAALCLVVLLGVAATGVAHACPNSDAEAAEDGGD